METHVHSVLQPLGESGSFFYGIAPITHSIKSYSANRIQRLPNRKGNTWLDESYDRIVRDEEKYLEKLNYIVDNPVKAGLVDKPEDYRWLFIEGSG